MNPSGFAKGWLERMNGTIPKEMGETSFLCKILPVPNLSQICNFLSETATKCTVSTWCETRNATKKKEE